jgi:HNH endonuclease
MKLEAEQHRDLATRQHEARKARSHVDALGMVHIHLELQPHVGAPIVARAEAEAQRLAGTSKAQRKSEGREGEQEPFERHLADAYARLLSGGAGKGRAKRPELTVLVSHSVAKRGWKDVKPGEMCKIPGIGPVAPQIAKEIASDAFLNGVFFDGKDLRHFKRWSRDVSVEIRAALELGKPPDFDGIRCQDCGNHFRTELDHVHPRVAHGPTSTTNLEPRCWSCHQAKTARDRKEGRLRADPRIIPTASGRCSTST